MNALRQFIREAGDSPSANLQKRSFMQKNHQGKTAKLWSSLSAGGISERLPERRTWVRKR